MESTFKERIDRLLEKIDRKLKKYETYPEEGDIKSLIKDRVEDSKEEIFSKQSIMKEIEEINIEKKRLAQMKENYYDTSWINVISTLFMYVNNTDESQKQLLRANYNMQSNNQIFRILNLIYNNDLKDSYLIDENNYILKMNISFFVIEYIFETIKKDLNGIINSTEDYTLLVDKLIYKYKGDVQSIGDVLMSEKIKNPILRIRYNEIKEYLKTKGFNQSNDSKFKYMRNAASHGEFYPDFENPSNIKIIVEGHGTEKEILNYLDLIDFTESKLDLIPDTTEIDLFLKLFRSNNMTNTVLSLMEDIDKKEELICKLCILSLFNIVQYNNENYFRIDKKDVNKKSYADKINMKYFFSTSYPIEERNNFEIMQTIKNAIGHMNITFDDGIFSFYNEMAGEKCTCSLGKLLMFITEDELYDLTIATSYYEQHLKIQRDIREKINSNGFLSPKDYMSPDSKEKYDETYGFNKVDLSNYEFYENNVNKKI